MSPSPRKGARIRIRDHRLEVPVQGLLVAVQNRIHQDLKGQEFSGLDWLYQIQSILYALRGPIEREIVPYGFYFHCEETHV